MRLPGAATVVFALALVTGLGRPAAAQTRTYGGDVTSADVQRLQDTIYDVSRELSQVRSRDAALSSQLQAELDDARDEAIYLKVKVRKNEPIARSDYVDLRDRVEN